MAAENKYEAVQLAIHAFSGFNIDPSRNEVSVPVLKQVDIVFDEMITFKNMEAYKAPYFTVIFQRILFDVEIDCEPVGWRVIDVLD